MNCEEFVNAIKATVRDTAVTGTLALLREPPGRKPRPELLELSGWFKRLNDEDKKMLEMVLMLNADAAVFGFLAVLDGERAIEDTLEKGEFELVYVRDGEKTLLNDPTQEMLHDIFKAD